MAKTYDFSGWATRVNVKCSDGRTIMKDAFKHNDGKEVPLIWNHQHTGPDNVLGKALLEHHDEGVYAYCSFNDTESGKLGKQLVQHGDITALSIYANQLKEHMSHVMHGNIREVSLVLAGANPEASIQTVMAHSADGVDIELTDEAYIFTGEDIVLHHSDEAIVEVAGEEELTHADESKKGEENVEKNSEKTVQDIIDSMNEDQKTVMYAMVGQALEQGADDESEGGEEEMKQNAFEGSKTQDNGFLSHSDEMAIIAHAKSSSVGTLQRAIAEMTAEGSEIALAHGIDQIEELYPDYKLVKPGAPELLERDQSWVSGVMAKVHKSPISRIRTRQADARIAELRAKGYQKKGDEKTLSANIKLISRTTDPQTVYRKDTMHRDDIIDITDFDVVAYQWDIMKKNLLEEIAQAILIGDGRDDGDADKIHETHIRSIWNDEELYTIHADVDIEAARQELQGTNTGANFGDNYVYAEAIITAALYSREKYKGSGTPDLYCTPHLVNVMLLARDLNGRRIYNSKADLAAALNVGAIHTIEQFEGKTRTTRDGEEKKLLGLFVNLSDYQLGCTKGGEITKFDQFDIDFNQYKYLIETRLSGALTKVYSAIALEEPVSAGAEG